MRFESYTIDCPTSVSEGTPQRIEDLREKWVQVAGTFTATIAIEGTIDGSNWFVVAAVAAPGAVEVPQTVRSLRCNVTAHTAGAPLVTLGAGNARSL
jgi:hypothetical protein